MILPIFAYGQPVLRKKATPITRDYPNLNQLIDDMYETMYSAKGVGLAAPQIGKDIRLFIVDSIQLDKKNETATGIKKVFINAEILEESGDPWLYEEGCLSIPDLHAEIERNPTIKLKYVDLDWNEHIDTYEKINARVIQHEHDHIEGILFIDRMKPLKRRLINGKLEKIKKGDIDVSHPMRYVKT
ncbi:MAG TPA: peptide deformylase [Saprospiraceae bacterium]|nr:peptide deformylase [Saprospiraceae bacterium]